jgi:hypothetical protein
VEVASTYLNSYAYTLPQLVVERRTIQNPGVDYEDDDGDYYYSSEGQQREMEEATYRCILLSLKENY